MPSYPASLSAPEIVLWVLQIAIILYVIRRPGRIHEDKSVSPVACAFVLLLAWNFRLIYEFALGSSGFWYFVGDDPSRVLMSYSWSRDPFFITWDGIWQGGTFYLHGAAMRVVRDPMFASKMVSAFYGLFPLLGLYVFTQGLYRNRKLSLAAVLVTAPLWLHLLMSTGALAEMPMVGLMLTGVGPVSYTHLRAHETDS